MSAINQTYVGSHLLDVDNGRPDAFIFTGAKLWLNTSMSVQSCLSPCASLQKRHVKRHR